MRGFFSIKDCKETRRERNGEDWRDGSASADDRKAQAFTTDCREFRLEHRIGAVDVEADAFRSDRRKLTRLCCGATVTSKRHSHHTARDTTHLKLNDLFARLIDRCRLNAKIGLRGNSA